MTRRDLRQPEGHPADLLPEFVAGTLDVDRAVEVRRHVAGCEPCRQEMRAWQSIADAARERVVEAARRLCFVGLGPRRR